MCQFGSSLVDGIVMDCLLEITHARATCQVAILRRCQIRNSQCSILIGLLHALCCVRCAKGVLLDSCPFASRSISGESQISRICKSISQFITVVSP